MGRKFTLKTHKRKYARPAFSLPVSIPLTCNNVVSAAANLCTVRSRPLVTTCSTLQHLHECLWHVLPPDWKLHMEAGNSKLVIFKLRVLRGTPQVYSSLEVATNFSWETKLCGKLVQRHSQLLQNAPEKLCSTAAVGDVLEKLEHGVTVCIGNGDEQFLDLAAARGGNFYNQANTEIVAYMDEATPTVRHSKCELLVLSESGNPSKRCNSCLQHRHSLRSMISQQKAGNSSRTEPSSHVNYRYLTDEEKLKRLHDLHQQARSFSRKVDNLRKKIEEITEVQGSTLNQQSHQDMKEIMKENAKEIAAKYPNDSFARVFWEQQMKASSQRDARQMRWHPAMIKWCLYLQHRSSGAYETLRKSGCLHLPSQRTLRDYTHIAGNRTGFSKEVDDMLMKTAKIQECPEHQKYVAVIFDEMHIRADLVYDKHSGELIGFCDVGDINNYLLEVERSFEEHQNPVLAKTMLVFMVRGLFGSLKFPYAQYSTKDLSGDLIFQPFWDVVFNLEKCGFKVVAATADGASPNRAFLRMHFPSAKSKNFEYKTKNPFTAEDRQIYFFSDPPHLLKTIRNCMANAKRQLWCKGEDISWRHIVSLYYRDNGAAPLSLASKLKYEHVYLTSFSKMRVDLAAQALSGTVAAAIRLTGSPAAQKTAEFVELVNRFFDCLNVDEGKHTRNTFKDPIRPGDFRLKWLEDKFVFFLDEWEDSVRKREGEFSEAERNKMLLSAETLQGIRFTVKSFIGMVKYLFSQPNITSFLSEKISQDPLEKFFGIQRQRGRVNENPSVQEFCKNTQALRVIDSVCANVSKGNTRGNKSRSSDVVSDQPLAKRKRWQQKTKKI